MKKLILLVIIFYSAELCSQKVDDLRMINKGFDFNNSIAVDKKCYTTGCNCDWPYPCASDVATLIEEELIWEGYKVISQNQLNSTLELDVDINLSARVKGVKKSAYLLTEINFCCPVPITGNKLNKFSFQIVDVYNGNEIIVQAKYDGKKIKWKKMTPNLMKIISKQLKQ